MSYSKQQQLGKSKPSQQSVNTKTNRKLLQLQIEHDITHCEQCSAQAVSNAHRHNRDWYKGKESELLWDYTQVVFLCMLHHQLLDDRSQTSEEEKEAVFITLRGI